MNLDVVDGAVDEGGEGEMKGVCGIFEFQFFSFRYSELDDVRFVVRRVVAVGRAGIRFDIRFVH